jgi:alpha-tubulin suppressor-like RCC1 family protein
VNDVGELGLGATDGTASGVANDSVVHAFPAQIMLDKFLNGFSNVVMVANRDYHNIAVKADGSVWMWGANDQGQCGDGTTNDIYRPSPVVGMGPRVSLPLTVQTSVQPGSVDLSWSSVTGEYFTVECSTNLANGFSTVQSNILATPNTTHITVPAGNGTGYYRLRY